MKQIGLSAYATGLLALLAYFSIGYATETNQAGPSRAQGDTDLQSATPGTIPGVTEWLCIHKDLFSKEPANTLSGLTVLGLIERMATLEATQDFRMARLCLQNESNWETVRQIAQSQDCLQDIDGFLEALQEIARLDEIRRAQGLTREGQSATEQLGSLSSLDEPDLCEIESLKRVRDLMVLYEQYPNLYRYIRLRFESRGKRCLTLFASGLAIEIEPLRGMSSIFDLLERTQLRLGHNYNQQPPPFVPIPEFSDAELCQAIATEIRHLRPNALSFQAEVSRQRSMIRDLRRKCKPVAGNKIVSYYNKFIEFLDVDHSTPVTLGHLSSNLRHLIKLEICNRVSEDNFSPAVMNEILRMDIDEAQRRIVPSGETSQEPRQEHDQGQAASQAVDQLLDQSASEQVNTMPLPGSPRVESEEDFYASLAGAVAENYQQDPAIEPSGSHEDSDHH